MATDTQIREIEERLSNTIAGWMPKNARRSAEEGHVHGSGGMGPITGALGFLYKPGVAGGQIAHGDSAADGTLTLYGGTVHGSTISRIILGSDPKFATAANVWRNASDQVLWQQVSGSDASIFPGIIHANSTVNIGTFAGAQVTLARTGSSWNALTFNEALQARTDSAAANVNDPIIRDRTGAVRLQVNSLPTSPSGHIRVNGDFSAAGSKAGNLLVFEHKTNAILVKGTVGALTKTGTGTGVVILPPFDYTATAGNKNYRVEIDSGGTEFTATYRWSDDGGGTWQQSSRPLSGVGWYDLGTTGVAFAINDSGGTWDLGDRWDWVVIGTTNQVELLRADTVADALYIRNVTIALTSASRTDALNSTFNYTGTAGTANGGSVVLRLKNTGAGTQTGTGFTASAYAERGAGLGVTNLIGILAIVGDATHTTDIATAKCLVAAASSGASATYTALTGLHVNELNGGGAVGTVTGIDIAAQTVGFTATYNIRQRGTTGVNRFAAPTLIGADASPAAGVALELRGGRLRMAASTNDYIEDSAGNRHLTFASSATAVAVTSSFAGDLRINDQLGVGGAVATNTRLQVQTWNNLGNGASTMINVGLTGVQTANVTGTSAKKGFAFSGAYDLAGFALPSFIGISAIPSLDDTSGGSCTNFIAIEGQIRDGGTGAAITQAAAFRATAPNLTGAGAIAGLAGLLAENQGHGNVATAVGVDIKEQSGATVDNIGLRLNSNFMEGTEMTAPAAPAANNYRIFGQDNGAGKTELMVEFSSGGALQLAIQP